MFKKPKRKINKVFIHCSASDNPKHDDIKVIKKWHIARGFSDVGYHYFIKADGIVEMGRPLNTIPAAQKGHNTGSIAICLHGLNDFTLIQFHTLYKLCDEINVSYDDITFHGHNEVANKLCPVFDYKHVLGLGHDGRMTGTTGAQRRAQELNESRPLKTTRTAKGKNIAAIGTAGTAVSDIVGSIDNAKESLKPFIEVSQYIQYAFILLTLAGVLYMWHARKDDREKGYR